MKGHLIGKRTPPLPVANTHTHSLTKRAMKKEMVHGFSFVRHKEHTRGEDPIWEFSLQSLSRVKTAIANDPKKECHCLWNFKLPN